MALDIFIDRNSVSTTGTGNTDWVSADSTEIPVAALHIGGNATVNDSARNNAGMHYGMTDGTSHRCASAASANNISTNADATRGLFPNDCIGAVSPGALFAEGQSNHNAFIAGGETITNSNGFDQAFLWASMFFSGCTVSMEKVQLTNSVDTATNVDPGFAWDLVIVAGAMNVSSFNDDAKLSLGFMTSADDVQGCMMFVNADGVTASDMRMQMNTTYAGGDIAWDTGALVYGIDVQVGSGTSCDVYNRVASGTLDNIAMLFIQFTDNSTAKIVSWDTPTATGNHSVTGVGFTPIALIDLLGYASSYNAPTSGAAGGSVAVGLTTDASQYCQCISEENATGGSTDCQSMSTDVSVAVPLDDGTSSATTSLRATHVSMDADGWTRNWTERDSATARKCITLAIGASSGRSDAHSMGRGLGRGIGRGIG